MLKHRALLKSIIIPDSLCLDKQTQTYYLDNFNIISAQKLKFATGVQSKIFIKISDYVGKYTSVPSENRILKEFELDNEALEELEKVKEDKLLFQNSLKSLVDEILYEQAHIKFKSTLDLAAKISDKGVTLKNNKKLKGQNAAMVYLNFENQEFLRTNTNGITQGNLREGAKGAKEDYEKRLSQDQMPGLMTGLASIDCNLKGIGLKELWLIAAHTGELKTTLAMNFAYSMAYEQQKDVMFVSLEMSYEVCRDLFVCIHSANFNLWAEHPEWKYFWPLYFDDVEDGTLTEGQKKFFDFLVDDFENNKDYGNIRIYAPETDFTLGLLRSWSTVENNKKPFDIIFLDYIELMKDSFKTKDYGVDLNQRIRDLKQFALHFNEGMGTRLVSAYQTNRKGKELADKNEGVYRLDSLSYANEAERSSDVIITSYLNEDLREQHKVLMDCLKSRKRAMFKPFVAKTSLGCRKVYELSENYEEEIDEFKGLSRNKNPEVA